ncbi:MAG TPA: translocation/assembly module TamB domain-containing protein [Vicinamibacterales bacterium]|nr:translocation/assembly module TamB domain-containing protein [Vicinamibacterales bacterium]
MKLLLYLRQHPAVRYAGWTAAILVALLAAAIVATLTIDLGPRVRELAERRGSEYLERSLTIGSLGIHLLTGRVIVTDLSIGGLRPADRPFFTAKRIAVSLDWLPLLAKRPDIAISGVDMSDWQMLVEKWEDAHNFPKFTRDDNQPRGPRRFTVTLRHLHAYRGQFAFEDHEAPWSIVCPNLDITIGNLPDYHGTAAFTGGLVRIQDDLPMWANMQAQFTLDGPRVHLQRIDLQSDGATTVARGDVDLSNWPNQKYEVRSRVDFPRMREIFFGTEDWRLGGAGDFTGSFALMKGGRRDLSGTFKSDLFTYGDYRFPSLYGSLRWTERAFDVWDAGSQFYGGRAAFTYAIKPLGAKTRPTATFDTALTGVDLAQFTDFQKLPGERFAGDATWHNTMAWTLGTLKQTVHGSGRIVVAPPAGFVLRDAAHRPMSGDVVYTYTPDAIAIEQGRFETAKSHVTFTGTTAWGDRSRLPFHVVSDDWQESDQLLAGIMTDFGSPAHAVEFYGRGEFDGVMTGAFRRPRVEGDFAGTDVIAFDTLWGSGGARIVVQNSYVDVTDGAMRLGDSEIHADGRFSLGYPRDDGGEEIDARFRAVRRDLDSLRHAFGIDDYAVTGRLSGDFHLTGQYEKPLGFGAMTIDDGVAYGEPFRKATASLRFDGNGVQLDGITIAKGAGTVTGAALVRWDGTYSFTGTGEKIPASDIAFLNVPQAPLAGVAGFTASGSGAFASPRYDVTFAIDDVKIADQRVGRVSGTLAMRNTTLGGTFDVVHGADVAEGRLTIHGTGRIVTGAQPDAQVTLRFDDSSLDPYVRMFEPRLSPYISTVVSGSIRISGALNDLDLMTVDATADSVEMTLFDQAIRNDGPLRLLLDKRRVTLERVQLVGENTRLGVTGGIDFGRETIAVRAVGDANLGLLQGVASSIRGSGRATLRAAIDGPLRKPQFSGTATIENGRVRHSAMPASLDAINGTVTFDAGGVRLDSITATMGEGTVQFDGRIGFDGYVPTDLNVTARGQDVRLRYPEGVRSIVDADLAVTGTVKAPLLGGTVTVKSAVWARRLDAPGSIFDLAGRRSGASAAAPVGGAEPPTNVPLKYDVHIIVPSTLRVDTNIVRLVANADLNLRGTYDRPTLFGHGDIERGEVIFEGQRYRITRGSIDFTNPTRIEPFFDVEAETNVRVPGQTYRVTVGATGTAEQLRPIIASDPPLPTADVLALLFSDVARSRNTQQDLAPELRALQSPTQAQTDILTARATQALAAPISSEVGKVVEQTFGVDTFQLTPSFVDPNSVQASRLNPTARLTIGKRISDRVYFTFSRSLGATLNDQILLLEIEESDRLSWILSRNEDSGTYALEFRVRHTF